MTDFYIASLEDLSQNDFDETFDMMSETRRKAILRYRHENDRRRSVLGERLARKGVSKLCGIAESEIKLARTEKGKPFVTNAKAFYSVSHSGNRVICAVSDKEIGVDIEKVRPMDLHITRISCTDSDREFVFSDGDENAQIERFFRVWTAKEAYFKFIGTGLESLQAVSYRDICGNCKQWREGEFLIAVYEEYNRTAVRLY